jgi:hypothetical protein
MPDAVSRPTEQFWLLTGEVPSGPFTVAQIHDKLATGDATWQTPACPVGGSAWLPLVRVRGIGPVAPEPAAEAPAIKTGEVTPLPTPPAMPPQHPSADPPAPVRAPPLPFTSSPPVPPPATPAVPSEPAPVPAAPKSEFVGIGIGIGVLLLLLAGVGYGVYWTWEQLRPATATEVCKKLDEVKTAADAKKYVTPRMHPLIDAMFAEGVSNPNDHAEWTQEIDGPRPDTKLVGFRGTYFVPEAGRRVRIEAHFVVVKSDGWKVDDMVITGVEGASLPGPVSLVDEHRRSLAPPRAPTPGTALPGAKDRPFVPGQSSSPTRSEWPRQKHPIEKVFLSLKDAVGWGGIVVIGLLLVAGVAIRESLRKKSPPA